MTDSKTVIDALAPLPLPGPDRVVLDNRSVFNWYNGAGEGLCSLTLLFEGGASEMTPTVQQLLVSQLLEGSPGKSAEDIADTLDRYGARFTPVISAHYTGFKVTALTSMAGEVFGYLSEAVSRPSFPARRLATASEQMKAAVRMSRQEVMAVASEKMLGLIAGRRHPLAVPVTEEAIDAVTPATLHEAFTTYFKGNGCTAFLGGSLDGEAVYGARRLAEAFPERPLSAQPLDIRPFTPELPGVRCFEPKDREQEAVCAGLPLDLQRADSDYISLRIAVTALGGYFGSRLMAEIRERMGLTYGINATLAGLQDGCYVNIAANCSPQSRAAMLDEIKNQMKRLAQEPPRGDELLRVKMYLLTSARQTLDNALGIINFHVTARLVGIPAGYFLNQQEITRRITSDDIAVMAEKYLQPGQLRVAVSG